jgi:hypothetical protein|tara:strand:+ start:486 stop:665 length:180 start_codon:yes stop_codon:yes gene_type:complete
MGLRFLKIYLTLLAIIKVWKEGVNRVLEYKGLKELILMEVQDQKWSGLLSVEEVIISLK